MTKEFVPHELSVKLKELGFDEPCFGYPKQGTVYPINTDMLPEWSAAPLFQQAFRWFREKGYKPNIVNDVSASKDGFYYFDIWLSGQILWETDYIFTTYEEAELACLTKLIEIVENDGSRLSDTDALKYFHDKLKLASKIPFSRQTKD